MKVLILGAGNAQIDAIDYCKEHGWTVYGCSYTNTDKGIPLLDHFKQVDIKDAEGIAAYAKEEAVDVVYSVGSDLAMPTVMKVSEMLNLPHFISHETAQICQNKSKMRAALGSDFRGNLPFAVVSSLEEAITFDHFPAMMKPTDSQGQRGCYRVNSREDIEENFEKSLGYSNEGRVILETFISGPEISVNTYSAGGKLIFAIVSDRIVFDEFPGGIIKEHLIPSEFAGEETQKKAVDLAGRVIEKLKITDGPAYFQMKLEDGEPYILEVTPRLDGCHMWNLINHYCGVNLLDMALQHLVSGKVPAVPEEKPGEPMKLAFMCEAPGKPYDRSKYDVSHADYVCWYYENEDIVRKLNGFMEKGGYRIEKRLTGLKK